MWGYAPMSFEDWQHWLLGDDHDWSLFLAEADREPAGVALCRPQPTEPEIGSIRVVGVRRSWRRKGVGRALMLHAFADFRRRGMRGASLGVDAESLTGAQRLYTSVGMHVARESDIFERALVGSVSRSCRGCAPSARVPRVHGGRARAEYDATPAGERSRRARSSSARLGRGESMAEAAWLPFRIPRRR
jgi:GNAT superfamily N-acetyltransferase